MKLNSKKNMIYIFIILAVLIVWAAGSWFFSRVEEPVYDIVEKRDGYEIREYPAHIIAETIVNSTSKTDASNSGFMVIADYIFGNNTTKEKIAMTKPVAIQEEKENINEKIAMTKPVVTSADKDGNYTIGFIMPSKYTLESLPKPNDDRVILREVSAKRVAVLSFSGWYATNARSARAEEKLLELLARDNIATNSEPIIARYDPPMSMPFIMRNEVMIDVK